jgi:hypothetical protein
MKKSELRKIIREVLSESPNAAYLRKSTKQSNNSRSWFGKNHTGTEWTD